MRIAKKGSISYEIRNLKVGYKAIFPIGKRASVNSICCNIGYQEGKIFHTESSREMMTVTVTREK